MIIYKYYIRMIIDTIYAIIYVTTIDKNIRELDRRRGAQLFNQWVWCVSIVTSTKKERHKLQKKEKYNFNSNYDMPI